MIKYIVSSLIIGAVFLGLLLLLGGMLFTRFMPPEKIAANVKEAVHKSTGGTIEFKDIDLAFWPNINFETGKVSYTGPDAVSAVSFDKLRLSIALLPLFSRHVVVNEFLLEGPVLHGTLNGNSFSTGDFVKPPEKTAAEKSAPAEQTPPYEFSFDKIRITKGKVVASNQQDRVLVDDIDLDLHMPAENGKGPLQVTGSASYHGKRVDLSVVLDKPLDLANGKASPGQFSLKAEGGQVKGDGTLSSKGVLLNGSLTAEISSLTTLVSWLEGAPAGKLPFEKVSFSSAAQVSASDVILKGASLKLDDIAAKGDVNLSLGARPEIFARLSLNKIDLDRFLSTAAPAPGAAANDNNSAAAGWDTKPIDFSPLRALDADVQVKAQGFSLKGAEVGPSTLTATLKDGVLKFSSSEASLFGGKFAANGQVNAATSTLSLGFGLGGVQAQPVLLTFADFRKLSGTVSGSAAVSATGRTQQALISSLSGKGSVTFANGALEGIDLLKIAQLLQSRSTDIALGESSKTPFVSLGGTFTVAQGVATTNDLKMKSQILSADGQGNIDLPRKAVAFRVKPVLLSSSAANGSASLAIPVEIKGPFGNIRVAPDYAGLIKSALEDPTAVRQTIRNLKGNAKDTLKDLKQGIKDNPGAVIQNLLGGGMQAQ